MVIMPDRNRVPRSAISVLSLYPSLRLAWMLPVKWAGTAEPKGAMGQLGVKAVVKDVLNSFSGLLGVVGPD